MIEQKERDRRANGIRTSLAQSSPQSRAKWAAASVPPPGLFSLPAFAGERFPPPPSSYRPSATAAQRRTTRWRVAAGIRRPLDVGGIQNRRVIWCSGRPLLARSALHPLGAVRWGSKVSIMITRGESISRMCRPLAAAAAAQRATRAEHCF